MASYKQSEVSNLKKETDLYRELKRKIPKISWNRLENRSLLGTPDLLAYSINEHFFTLELKFTSAYRIRFSPHQIAFHVKHRKNTFILVACTPELGTCRLYPGSKILELVDSGLKLEPLAQGWELVRSKLESL